MSNIPTFKSFATDPKSAWEAIKLTKQVKKGGFPYGTQPGDGGLPEGPLSNISGDMGDGVGDTGGIGAEAEEVSKQPTIHDKLRNLFNDKRMVNRMIQSLTLKVDSGRNPASSAIEAVWLNTDDLTHEQETIAAEKLLNIWKRMNKGEEEEETDPSLEQEVSTDDENDQEYSDIEAEGEPETTDGDDITSDETGDIDTDVPSGEMGDEGEQDQEEKEEDPNRQGLIRTVKGAHLVFKRMSGDGTYEELWIFNTSPEKTRDELKIRKDILAGTDIAPGKLTSPDGNQTYELVTYGNAQLLFITGLVQ